MLGIHQQSCQAVKSPSVESMSFFVEIYDYFCPQSRTPFRQIWFNEDTLYQTFPISLLEHVFKTHHQVDRRGGFGMQWVFKHVLWKKIYPDYSVIRTLVIVTASSGLSVSSSISTAAMALTTSIPETTSPKTVCLPFKCACDDSVTMKN